jgi:hypothetical protein
LKRYHYEICAGSNSAAGWTSHATVKKLKPKFEVSSKALRDKLCRYAVNYLQGNIGY